MPKLLLDPRRSGGNRLLTERPEGTVGYLLRNGTRHRAPWLGFIARSAARELAGVRPVRLIDVAWIDEGDRLSPQWREVPPGHYVHGCLSDRGAYAVCDTVVATVELKGR